MIDVISKLDVKIAAQLSISHLVYNSYKVGKINPTFLFLFFFPPSRGQILLHVLKIYSTSFSMYWHVLL